MVVAVALLWAGLHFLVGALLLPRGLDRPVSLFASSSPWLVASAVAIVLWVGAYVGTLVSGAGRREQGLIVAGLALAAWATGNGTMDDWLELATAGQVVGSPSSAAYWPLVGEYIFFAVVMAGAAIAGSFAVPVAGGRDAAPGAERIRGVLGLEGEARKPIRGPFALLTTTIVIAVLMLVLTGPAVGHTLRGQVYFAVTVACALGVFVATRLVRTRHPIWYWPAPILAGLVGALVAALKPDLFLPSEYDQLNSIPAWGLVRPLPVEMVGVGVAITLWTLRATATAAQSDRE